MRIEILKFFYLFLLAVIGLRLYYWQVLKYDELTARAEEQHLDNKSTPAPRGNILTSDNSLLAGEKITYNLIASPKSIIDKKTLVETLAQLIDPAQRSDSLNHDLLQKLSQDLYWVSLIKNLSFDDKKNIENIKIEGLGFEAGSTRFYPESSSSAHLLGFVGSDSVGRQIGYFGLEGFYNRELRGIPGILQQEKDARGLPILSGLFYQKSPTAGSSLRLNIDRTVQFIAEQKLKEGFFKYGAKSASVIIMDPLTGDILAMAAYPNYDPGHFTDFPKENFKNPNVADTYEPGSTFKVLVMGAGINEDVIKPDTKCDICSGPIQLGGYQIRTWNNQYNKDTDMTGTIIHSDNTGMVFVSGKLGLEKMQAYIASWGFGSNTGIDLQDETSPDIRPKNQWREIDLATASFGQGIAATPIQMIQAIATIANGGKLMEPHVVREIITNQKTIEIKPKIIRQVFKPETTKIIAEMMVSAVDKGEANYYKKAAGVKDFKIAGKTGTAQIPVAGHYDPNKTVASFVGFAPADNPKFIILVKYNEPTASIFGAETAAPTFFAIAKELFTYYGITPE